MKMGVLVGLQEIELGPWPANIDRLEDWILSVGDAVDLDHRISMTSRVISREFAKRPLDLPLPREQAAFKDVFGSIRNIQAFRRLNDPIWLALHHCGHFVFELVIQKGRCRHQQNNGLIGDGDRYRQVLAARFSMRQLDGNVVLRHGLNPDTVRALHH
jgi:hypothetical protein